MTITSMLPSGMFGDGGFECATLLEFLYEIDSAQTDADLFVALDRALSRLVTYERFSIGQVDRAARRITMLHERGISLGLPARYETLPADSRSLTRPVVEEGRTVLHTVPDSHDVYRGDPLRRRFGLRHVLATPVPIDGSVAAVLKLYCTSPKPFSEIEARIVETFARVLGLALATRRACERQDQDEAERMLTEAIEHFAHAASPEELLDHLQGAIVTVTDATLLRFELDHGAARYAEGRNEHPDLLDGQPISEVGPRAVQRIQELLHGELDPDSLTTLFADPDATGETAIPIRPMDPCGDLISTSAVAIAVLGGVNEPLGVIVAAWPEDVPQETAARHAEWIARLCAPAGPALHRLMMIETLAQQVAELDTVRRLTDTVARTAKLQDALEVICRTSRFVTNIDFVAVAETVSDQVVWRAVSGAQDASFLHHRLPVPPPVLSEILQHRYEIILSDVRQDPELTPEIMPVHTREHLRSTVVLPVHINARLRALMIASQRHLHVFSEPELSLLHALAGTVATAIAANDARMTELENN